MGPAHCTGRTSADAAVCVWGPHRLCLIQCTQVVLTDGSKRQTLSTGGRDHALCWIPGRQLDLEVIRVVWKALDCILGQRPGSCIV